MKLQFNFFCRDIEAQLAFYRDLLDLPEASYTRSPIYRSVHTVDFQLGFHAARAYELLGLQERRPAEGDASVDGYPTLMVDSPDVVNTVASRVRALGGDIIQGPFPTYYGQWQVVITDPEDHVFRVASEDLPEGVETPTIQFLG